MAPRPRSPAWTSNRTTSGCPWASAGSGTSNRSIAPFSTTTTCVAACTGAFWPERRASPSGCDPIRQVYRTGDRSHAWDGKGIRTWSEALEAPGSSQLRLLKQVLLERSYFTRLPAQPLWLREADGAGDDPIGHVSVARCSAGRYILAYVPIRQMLTLDTSVVQARRPEGGRLRSRGLCVLPVLGNGERRGLPVHSPAPAGHVHCDRDAIDAAEAD